MMDAQINAPRILLLSPAQSYRAEAFLKAAERLQVEVVTVVDMPSALAEKWDGHGRLALDFNQPDTAVDRILAFAAQRPFTAIFPVDDGGVLIAARAAAALGLPHNDPGAAAAARDKGVMRQMLQAGGVPVPAFHLFDTGADSEMITAVVANQIGYPCVVKPRTLNGSRGVIRADNAADLTAVVARVKQLLTSIGLTQFLIEEFLPGVEVALEGVLHDGRLQTLALFDKPDPLDGPFFEETIYVTPSRLPDTAQAAINEMAARGARAIGLRTGPVHAELRWHETDAWIVEVNGRSIGGLCGQTLRFEMRLGEHPVSLEELLLRQAAGLDVAGWQREQSASGVMMIPIPKPGILRGVDGLEAAQAVPDVSEVVITAPLNNRIVTLPEGESYLGFIFASGERPAEVEMALRQAHGRLHFTIDEEIPLRMA